MKKLALLVIASCLACAPAWVEARGRVTSPSGRYSLQFPEGWAVLNQSSNLLATRDGVPLQHVSSRSKKLGEPMPASKKAITKGMLPEEAAEVMRDELIAETQESALVVDENAPATLAGRPGFRLAFHYRTGDGLRIRGVFYGLVADDDFYGLLYQAAARVYFDRGLAGFEAVKASFRLEHPTPAAARR